MHELIESKGWKLAVPQSVQPLAAATEYVPAVHAVGAEEDGAHMLPAGHGKHTLSPVAG